MPQHISKILVNEKYGKQVKEYFTTVKVGYTSSRQFELMTALHRCNVLSMSLDLTRLSINLWQYAMLDIWFTFYQDLMDEAGEDWKWCYVDNTFL